MDNILSLVFRRRPKVGRQRQRLLQVMAYGGGWTVDALVDASGLSASTVLSTLLLLELDGSVRNREFLFEPRVSSGGLR